MALSVAVSLCVLGLSLSLVYGQPLTRLSVAGESDDLTDRIVSFTVFDDTTPFRCHTTNTAGNDWFDPEGVRMWPERLVATPPGPTPADNEILETSIHHVAIDLYRGADYFTLDGQWCCGLVSDANNRRCVTFTPCPTLPVLTNGVITYNRDTNVATYSCDSGYRLEGNDGNTTRTCSGTNTSAGTWSGSQPSCVVLQECLDLPSNEIPNNGSVAYFALAANTNGTINARPVGVRATSSCDTGFFFVWDSGNVHRDCQSGGTWSGRTPTCEIVCPDLTVPANSAIVYSGVSANSADHPNSPVGGQTNARPVGIEATYSCPGSQFTLVGSATRTCQSDRSWSGSEPPCQRFCPILTDLPSNGLAINYNMNAISNARPPGTVATYSCMTGYLLTGTMTRTCHQTDGTWNGTAPTCTAICTNIPDSENRIITYDMGVNSNGRLEGTTATHSCDNGFRLATVEVTRTCQNDRTWSGNNITCERVPCGSPPSISNGTSGTPTSTVYQGTVDYSCSDGHLLDGSSTVTCQADGQWSTRPTCILVDCGPSSTPENGIVVLSFQTFLGSVATYSCDSGYSLIGSPTRTCGADRNWSPQQPTCAFTSISTPSGPGVAGSAFSLSCVVEADSLQPTISYQWLRGETVLTTGPLLEFQPHLFLSDSGEYTCRASISSPRLDQDHIITQTYQLTFESLSVQLRFSDVVNCGEYAQENTISKTSEISSILSQGVESLCSCGFSSSLLSSSLIRCFSTSDQVLTFRAELRPTATASVVNLVDLIEQWTRQERSIVVQGLGLPLVFNCPTVIPQLSSDECPEDIRNRTESIEVLKISTSSTIGGVLGGLVLILIIVIIIIVVVVVVVKKRHSQSKDNEQSSQDVMEPPVVLELSELPEYESIAKYQDGATFDQVESSEPTKDYNLTANSAYCANS